MDKNLTIDLPIRDGPFGRTSAVVWMSREEWFRKPKPWTELQDPGMRNKIRNRLDIWSAQALIYAKDDNWYPIKNATVEFSLQEGKYVLGPWDLTCDANDYMFERISNTITEDLYSMGAVYVSYTGMLD